jgi:acetyl/propionyl-CoA carboxylase alpha subunit
MLHKILIANRGEIALRIQRAAKSLHISTVAIYSEGEASAPHVIRADESVFLGSGSLGDTYLNTEKIIAAAKKCGATAIHPGYGFLSESDFLAEACNQNGIRFIGPSPEVLRLMGNKPEAKALAERLQIPVLKNHPVTPETATQVANSIVFPVIIKSAFGGGGKGMQAIYSDEDIQEQVSRASRMSQGYFGNGTVYLEPYIEKARHIEVQILGDDHGNLVHLYERDCTIQRNYQKIIEEAPAPGLDESVRKALLDAALKLCRHVHYSGAGTVEFLVDRNGRFYFMEMNPRIQVEHPVTEEITGIDIVAEQLRIAAGMPLSFRQEAIQTNGHAIEVRLYSEDPFNNFTPSTAPVTLNRLPVGPGIRIETDLSDQCTPAGSQFDPLLCKIITRGAGRQQAIDAMIKALEETIIEGPVTNLLFLKALLNTSAVVNGDTDTRFCENHLSEILAQIQQEKEIIPDERIIAAFLYLRFLPHNLRSANPWKRIGAQNIMRQIEISDGQNLYKVPFKLISPEKAINTTSFNWHDINSGFFSPSGKFADQPQYKGRGSSHTQDRMSHPPGSEQADTTDVFARGAIPVSFTWNESIVQALVDQQSENSVMVRTEKNSKEIFFTENLSGKIVFYWNGFSHALGSPDLMEFHPLTGTMTGRADAAGDNRIISPLHGKVISVLVQNGQHISKGDLLMVIESMKSENHITAHRNGRIKSVEVQPGMQVADRMPLILLEEA